MGYNPHLVWWEFLYDHMQPVYIVKKGKTTQRYDGHSRRIPVTLLDTPPVYLADIKTASHDGYDALKLTMGTAKRIDNPTKGSLAKKGITTTPEMVGEIRVSMSPSSRLTYEQVDGVKMLKAGDVQIGIGSMITPSQLFRVGDVVDVTGLSKGKGFQGVVKRHGFRGGPKTHGQSDRHRAPGSVGSGTTPGRINKGKRMAGRMGGDRVTIQGLTIVQVSDTSIQIKGLVPGTIGTPLVIRLREVAS